MDEYEVSLKQLNETTINNTIRLVNNDIEIIETRITEFKDERLKQKKIIAELEGDPELNAKSKRSNDQGESIYISIDDRFLKPHRIDKTLFESDSKITKFYNTLIKSNKELKKNLMR